MPEHGNDSRLLGVIVLGAGGGSSGFAAAGASWNVVAWAAFAGALVVGAVGVLAVRAWRDSRVGPRVAAVAFAVIGDAAFSVGMYVRIRRF
jgi:uncharacterized membrane protein YjjB (DUF3815 family)